MVATLLLAVVVAGSILALVFQGLVVVYAFAMPRLDPAGPLAQRSYPLISVVIPARNEEEDLPACLDGLLAQDYPALDILVVDGGSTDRTRDVARLRGPRVRWIEEPPLPPGWTGKNWACDVGSRASTAPWILFTDADMRYERTAVRATFEWAEAERADLATLAPHIETQSFWERLILPFYTQMVLTYFRTPRVNRSTSRAAMANGQFTLVRRSSYERVGGHAAIRSSVLEDVRLAQEFRKAGFLLRVAWAPSLLETRMYRTRAEMFEGLLKNVHGPRFSAVRQCGFLAALVAGFWLPLAVLPLAVFWGLPWLAFVGAILYVALFGKHYAFDRALGGDGRYGLLFPLAVAYYIVLVGTSIARGVRRRPLVWKGREYPLDV